MDQQWQREELKKQRREKEKEEAYRRKTNQMMPQLWQRFLELNQELMPEFKLRYQKRPDHEELTDNKSSLECYKKGKDSNGYFDLNYIKTTIGSISADREANDFILSRECGGAIIFNLNEKSVIEEIFKSIILRNDFHLSEKVARLRHPQEDYGEVPPSKGKIDGYEEIIKIIAIVFAILIGICLLIILILDLNEHYYFYWPF